MNFGKSVCKKVEDIYNGVIALIAVEKALKEN